MPLLVEAVTPALPEDAVVVSPDVGRLRATSAWAERLGRPLVVLHKQRLDGGYTETACLVGEVRGRTCLLVDDMISTGGTLVQAARVLQQEGAAAPLLAAATHGLLVDQARTRLREAGIGHLWLTDTLPVVDPSPDTHVLSVAALVAEALRETAGDYWQGEGDA
jgi:ribose-phosphate pyrophosphokinase